MKTKRLPLLVALTLFSWGGPAYAQDSAAAEEPVVEEGAESGETTAPEGVVTEEGATSEGEVMGPGGRPLRTDYPGTDESLRARMDTEKIEGLQVDPNAPQEAYSMRIQELETKIDDLKEKVFQSKTRIVLLRETLLSGNLASARANVIHRTELGAAFNLREAFYSLDGTKIYGQVDRNGSLADKSTFEVYNGSISPGNHTISIGLKYQGSGYAVFSYFDGDDFEIKSSCQFKAEEGKNTQIKVVTFLKGDVTTSVDDRPSVRCEVQYFDNRPQNGDDVAAEGK